MRSLTLKLIPVLAVLFIGISGEVFAQASDSCREEPVSAAEATCGDKYPCLKMTLCGLIGFVHDTANNSVTGYFVDANPENLSADQYPTGAYLENPDIENVYPPHYVELTVKQGRYTEFDDKGKKVRSCDAGPGAFCRIAAEGRVKDLDLFFLPQDSQDPKPEIDVAAMLDETKLLDLCSSHTSSSIQYFHLKPGLDLKSKFLEATITLDLGTKILAKSLDCTNHANLPNYKLAKAAPFEVCQGAPAKLAEKVNFEWLGAESKQFKLKSKTSGHVFIFEPLDDTSAVVLAFTNEVKKGMHHDVPFRWLYRLTSNDEIENHFFLPSGAHQPCELLGSKCPVLLLNSP